MSERVILDVNFNDAAGLSERLKQVARVATTQAMKRGERAFSSEVVYVLGTRGETLTRLILVEETLTDGSTVLNARLCASGFDCRLKQEFPGQFDDPEANEFGRAYANSACYIERLADGRWHLPIERSEWTSDDLAELEAILYREWYVPEISGGAE